MMKKERNYGCRFQEVYIYGFKSIIMENELLRIVSVVDKGCEIVEFNYKKMDLDFAWRTNNGLSCLKYYSKDYTDFNTLTDYYTGGWFEAFPICGSGGDYKGTTMPLYGEVCYLPWEYSVVKDTEEEILLRFCCKTLRSPFYLEKIFKLKTQDPVFYIEEKIENLATEETFFNIGYHPNFGKSFIDNDLEIEINGGEIDVLLENENSRFGVGQKGKWPFINDRNGNPLNISIMPPINSKVNEVINIKDLKSPRIIIKNKDKKLDLKLTFDKIYKHAILWIVRNGDKGYPRYGNTNVLCVLPKTNHFIDLKDVIKNKDYIEIKPGEIIKTWMNFEVIDNFQ